MDIKAQIIETAGKTWHVLHDDGPQTLAQLKKKLNAPSEIAAFALGWLAREDQVEITQEKKSFKVALKKS